MAMATVTATATVTAILINIITMVVWNRKLLFGRECFTARFKNMVNKFTL